MGWKREKQESRDRHRLVQVPALQRLHSTLFGLNLNSFVCMHIRALELCVGVFVCVYVCVCAQVCPCIFICTAATLSFLRVHNTVNIIHMHVAIVYVFVVIWEGVWVCAVLGDRIHQQVYLGSATMRHSHLSQSSCWMDKQQHPLPDACILMWHRHGGFRHTNTQLCFNYSLLLIDSWLFGKVPLPHCWLSFERNHQQAVSR